jgi:hypothetical protein
MAFTVTCCKTFIPAVLSDIHDMRKTDLKRDIMPEDSGQKRAKKKREEVEVNSTQSSAQWGNLNIEEGNII